MTEFEFLYPLNDQLLEKIQTSGHPKQIGKQVDFYHDFDEIDLGDYQIAILGIEENQSSKISQSKFTHIRENFYQLYPGNWSSKIIDLGNIQQGNTPDDTRYLVEKILSHLLKQKLIPIILGGNKELIYAQYRAYSEVKYMVNLLGVSHTFDLGDADLDLSATNYLSHIVVKKPYNLFNYTNLGYQTFYVNQDEIELMERLLFECYRLGGVKSNLSMVEPLFRDADFTCFDMTSLKSSEIGSSSHHMVNGFTAQEFCAFSRYAGISDKTSSYGVYELQQFNDSSAFASLISQMIWYIIEGINLRFNEEYPQFNQNFTKFTVPIEDQNLVFLESKTSGRWWIEIPYLGKGNKLKEQTFISCSKEDYLNACKCEFPERWIKSKIKNEL